MLTKSQLARLQSIQRKPWSGSTDEIRVMKADWDVLERLEYVTPRLVSTATHNGAEVWEYAITHAGRTALADAKDQQA